MSISYSVRTIALALGVPSKWIDNILSHYLIPGVSSARQGVERGISGVAVRVLEIVRILNHELGIPLPRAVSIAIEVGRGDSRFVSRSGAEIRFSLEAIDHRLRERLIDAIEATPRMRRGRPPKSR